MEYITPITQMIDNFTWDSNTPLSSWVFPASTSVTYLVVVFLLKQFMKNRKPMSLKGVSIIHNFNLILLSFAMMAGVLEAAYRQALEEGPFSLICERTPFAVQGRIGFWIYVFYLSKYYELFDTVLLALKKKPLIFLHVFHHMAMVPITWQWLNDQWLVGSWWCTFVNSFIHTIMYYYYLQTSLGNDCWFKKYITTAQIVQFLTGTAMVGYWFTIRNKENCQGGLAPAIVSFTVNSVFILLFIKFYINSYKKGPAASRPKKE
ncbi:steroid isomerase [Cavenderia fasciculata]|uniref:Elongation of fatty acids protein n=1 Tax=Cavenderia fasciculata TaxID=261658 RepID=F4PLZ5_CACFS|nr:steroid isomerase [Cavenderia fasciculata]EGG23549.1 steroid isomerase [Cavenderia fasciculata]|eukprot:XP_004361400.1 steroid isomerase [Cavenderia fasciculata]